MTNRATNPLVNALTLKPAVPGEFGAFNPYSPLQRHQKSPGGGALETYIAMPQYEQWLGNMTNNYPAFNADNPWAQMFQESSRPLLSRGMQNSYYSGRGNWLAEAIRRAMEGRR